MLRLLATARTSRASDIGLVLTTFGFGLRHGIDWDHIAALTDITSSQDDTRRSMFFATLYALGHALVVFLLGLGAIVLASRLPSPVDAVMQRVVGATLIGLGLYVFYALAKHGRAFRMRSRWMLVFAGVRRGVRWARSRRSLAGAVRASDGHHQVVAEVHHHDLEPAMAAAGVPGRLQAVSGHRHLVEVPNDPFLNYGKATAFGVGMIHGVGAETPTQVLLFLAAAGAGGTGLGIALLVCFLVGLLSSNALIALVGSFGFLGASRNFRLYVTVSVLTAGFSLVIGTLFLVGRSTLLPAFFGG